MKNLLSIPLFLAMMAVGCGGGEKKTETPAPTGDTGDTNTATPVTSDGNGTDGATAAADPALIAKGAAVWEENCSTCHGDAGEGSGRSPAVKGDGALSGYPTAEALFEYTKKEMPKDDPGGLSDDDYKAVVAWMRG